MLGLTFVYKHSQVKSKMGLRPFVNTVPGAIIGPVSNLKSVFLNII